MATRLNQFIKIVAATITPEFLASSNQRIQNIQFIGEKAFEVPNATDVVLQVRDLSGNFVDSQRITPGQVFNWPTYGGDFNGETWKVRATTNGDGVRCKITYQE